MADKEFEITTNTYIFAAVGGVLLGGLAGAALGGLQNIVAAGVVGAGTLAYEITSRRPGRPPVKGSVVVGPTGAAATVQGEF